MQISLILKIQSISVNSRVKILARCLGNDSISKNYFNVYFDISIFAKKWGKGVPHPLSSVPAHLKLCYAHIRNPPKYSEICLHLHYNIIISSKRDHLWKTPEFVHGHKWTQDFLTLTKAMHKWILGELLMGHTHTHLQLICNVNNQNDL